MGTQPARGYLQDTIAFVIVLFVRPTYSIFESHIDDILVHVLTKDKLLENLTLVFERFQKHNKITFNLDESNQRFRNGICRS